MNAYVRTNEVFDAFIDFDAAVPDPGCISARARSSWALTTLGPIASLALRSAFSLTSSCTAGHNSANAAIDRGTLGSTIIGQGTKTDNLVHVAHNVVIGRHCLIMGQVGFAGSARLGDYVVVASQSGIADHLELGDRVMVGAKSGVMRNVPEGGRVLGTPAAPDRQAKRQIIALQHFPELLRRTRELEKRVEELAPAPKTGALHLT